MSNKIIKIVSNSIIMLGVLMFLSSIFYNIYFGVSTRSNTNSCEVSMIHGKWKPGSQPVHFTYITPQACNNIEIIKLISILFVVIGVIGFAIGTIKNKN